MFWQILKGWWHFEILFWWKKTRKCNSHTPSTHSPLFLKIEVFSNKHQNLNNSILIFHIIIFLALPSVLMIWTIYSKGEKRGYLVPEASSLKTLIVYIVRELTDFFTSLAKQHICMRRCCLRILSFFVAIWKPIVSIMV